MRCLMRYTYGALFLSTPYHHLFLEVVFLWEKSLTSLFLLLERSLDGIHVLLYIDDRVYHLTKFIK